MGGAVNEIGGQRTGHGIAPSIRQLGLQYARRAGADEDAHPCRAIFLDGGSHRCCEAVLFQSELRQAVVTTVERSQSRGQFDRIDARDFADMGRQINGIERARQQPATALAQRIQRLIQTQADRAGCGKTGQIKRFQHAVNS